MIGPFIADFCCVAHRLIVEVDGGIHETLIERDHERDEYLRARGYRVLRVADEMACFDPDGIVSLIRSALG